MKKLAEISQISLNNNACLFLIDIIIKNKTQQAKWFKHHDLKRYYSDYAKTTGDRMIRAFRDSKLFEVCKSPSFKIRLKQKYTNTF